MRNCTVLGVSLLLCGLAFGQGPSCSVISAAAGRWTPIDPDYPSKPDRPHIVAAGSIISIYSPNIATGTYTALDPLPTVLGGVSVTTIASNGLPLPVPLIFVSQNQVNAVLPQNLTAGFTTLLTLTTSIGVSVTCPAYISTVSPALFSVDGTGGWLAAAQVVTVHADGSQTQPVPVAQYSSVPTKMPGFLGASNSNWVPIPIDRGSSTDITILELFGTGFRNATSVSQEWCAINGTENPPEFTGCIPMLVSLVATSGGGGPPYPLGVPLFAAAQGSYAGLDQINVVLTRDLPKGIAGVQIIADVYSGPSGGPQTGMYANVVAIDIK